MPKRSRSGLVSMPARVVAPTSVNGGRSSLTLRAAGPSQIMMPIWKSSSAGYRISSTIGESRWISSMNSTSRGSRLVSSAARSPGRSSTGPEVWRRLTPSSCAMMCDSVVLPRPGGPNSSTWSSDSLRLRAASMKIESCPRIFSWPTYSSSRRGRSARSRASSRASAGLAATTRWKASLSMAIARLCRGGPGTLAAEVQGLVDDRDHLARGIDDVDAKRRLVLIAGRGRLARAIDRVRLEAEARVDGPAPGLHVADRAGLVPHDVVAPEVVEHHQRMERVGHREHRAAELRAEVVALEEPEAELDVDLAVVFRDTRHAYSGAAERRPQVEADPEHPRRHADVAQEALLGGGHQDFASRFSACRMPSDTAMPSGRSLTAATASLSL